MALVPINNYDLTPFTLVEKYAEAWQDVNDLKAFLFHRNDIECILNEKEAAAVRFYMGIKENGTIKCPDMMVVGVNESNEDIISLLPKDSGPENEIRTGIYDFTMPCPRTCDLQSDLYFNTGPGTIGVVNCAARDVGRAPSTNDECNIEGFQISVADGSISTLAWQTLFNLKSVLFKKEDLAEIYAQLNADDIRVYFGLDAQGNERIILVGVDAQGFDIFPKDENGVNEPMYVNSASLCTKSSITTCDVNSPLYH
jgi:uncharacterized protein YpmB